MTAFWLDLGAGHDAEWWRTAPPAPGVRVVALDPLITSGMVASGRVPPPPPGVTLVGAAVQLPSRGVPLVLPAGLPFRDGVFEFVFCAFVFHLYLEIVDLALGEIRRVLRPGGRLQLLVPHLGDPRSDEILRTTPRKVSGQFTEVATAPYAGPTPSFWAELYAGRTWEIRAVRPG